MAVAAGAVSHPVTALHEVQLVCEQILSFPAQLVPHTGAGVAVGAMVFAGVGVLVAVGVFVAPGGGVFVAVGAVIHPFITSHVLQLPACKQIVSFP